MIRLNGTMERELWSRVYVGVIRKEKYGEKLSDYTTPSYAAKCADEAVEQLRERY